MIDEALGQEVTLWPRGRPDKNGTPFTVIFAERIGYQNGNDFKRVYLRRGTPTWRIS